MRDKDRIEQLEKAVLALQEGTGLSYDHTDNGNTVWSGRVSEYSSFSNIPINRVVLAIAEHLGLERVYPHTPPDLVFKKK